METKGLDPSEPGQNELGYIETNLIFGYENINNNQFRALIILRIHEHHLRID